MTRITHNVLKPAFAVPALAVLAVAASPKSSPAGPPPLGMRQLMPSFNHSALPTPPRPAPFLPPQVTFTPAVTGPTSGSLVVQGPGGSATVFGSEHAFGVSGQSNTHNSGLGLSLGTGGVIGLSGQRGPVSVETVIGPGGAAGQFQFQRGPVSVGAAVGPDGANGQLQFQRGPVSVGAAVGPDGANGQLQFQRGPVTVGATAGPGGVGGQFQLQVSNPFSK